jgi:hypothetical protein
VREAEAMKHVRKTNASVRDRRFRGRDLYANKPRPTLCGAEPTDRDWARDDAKHVVAKFSTLKPEWVAVICPACRALL